MRSGDEQVNPGSPANVEVVTSKGRGAIPERPIVSIATALQRCVDPEVVMPEDLGRERRRINGRTLAVLAGIATLTAAVTTGVLAFSNTKAEIVAPSFELEPTDPEVLETLQCTFARYKQVCGCDGDNNAWMEGNCDSEGLKDQIPNCNDVPDARTDMLRKSGRSDPYKWAVEEKSEGPNSCGNDLKKGFDPKGFHWRHQSR